MSTEENKTLIRRYFDELSGKEKPLEIQDKYIADSDQELKEHILFFEAAFPLYEVIEDDMIADDMIAVLARFRGTHHGDVMGIAPTGKEAEVPFAITYRIAEGKVVEHWMSFDRMAMMEQLSLQPA